MVKTAKSAVLYTGSVHVPEKPVVDELVRTTLRECLHDLPPSGRERVRILDPACGAGIFLLAAYRFLAREDPGRAGLLSRSLSATDIDAESVSAARLVLMLASVSDRTNGTSIPPPAGIRAVAENLVRTVRCGNALIAPDFFIGRQVHPFNAEERRRVNAFSWEDAFPEVLATGGFDAVIGAPPPYTPFAVKGREEYFQTHYSTYAQGAGLYAYFAERALALAKPGGMVSFLVPGTFLRSDSARPFRRLLLSRQLVRVTGTGTSRFLQDGDAGMYILSLKNQPAMEPFAVGRLDAGREFAIDQRTLDDGGWILSDRRAGGLFERLLSAGTPLDRYVMGEIVRGGERDGPAIAFPEYCRTPVFVYCRERADEVGGPFFVIDRDDAFLAGVLNSSLARFILTRLCPHTDRGYHLTPACVGKFPVIVPDFDRFSEKSRHDRIAALVGQGISLQEYGRRAKTDQERRLVQQEIDATGVKIDALVYELYNLSAEEIAVVEDTVQ
jgi:hypothetical protein